MHRVIRELKTPKANELKNRMEELGEIDDRLVGNDDSLHNQKYYLNASIGWRQLFVINEFNEISMQNLVCVEVVLIWYLGLMKAKAYIEGSTDMDPDVHWREHRSPQNYVIKFFFTILWMGIVSGVIYAWRRLWGMIFPLAYEEFLDLCTVANQSMFIFDQKFHGYYIHGQFPGETADLTLQALKIQLDEESIGN